jgi:cell division septation protein DedD
VFGDASTLSQVQQLYPGAVAENSALGRLINVGAFANRDLAMARVFELRARGFNSRLVYRRVQYR